MNNLDAVGEMIEREADRILFATYQLERDAVALGLRIIKIGGGFDLPCLPTPGRGSSTFHPPQTR